MNQSSVQLQDFDESGDFELARSRGAERRVKSEALKLEPKRSLGLIPPLPPTFAWSEANREGCHAVVKQRRALLPSKFESFQGYGLPAIQFRERAYPKKSAEANAAADFLLATEELISSSILTLPPLYRL